MTFSRFDRRLSDLAGTAKLCYLNDMFNPFKKGEASVLCADARGVVVAPSTLSEEDNIDYLRSKLKRLEEARTPSLSWDIVDPTQETKDEPAKSLTGRKSLNAVLKSMKNSSNAALICRLPKYISTLTTKVRIRIWGQTASNDSLAFTRAQVHFLLNTPVTTTSTYNLISSYRLIRVAVLMIDGADGQPSTDDNLSSIVPGTGQSYVRAVTENATVSTQAGGIMMFYVPPKNSEMGWWHTSQTDTTTFITLRACFGATGTTVADMIFEVTLRDQIFAPVAKVVAGATVGSLSAGLPLTTGTATLLNVDGYTTLAIP
jgi:hypothetical protein